MRRRAFLITGAAALCPCSGFAQQNARVRRIGFLTSASEPSSFETSYLTGFPQGMRELGYVEGKDYVIEWRFAGGRVERFRDLATRAGAAQRRCHRVRDAHGAPSCAARDQHYPDRARVFH